MGVCVFNERGLVLAGKTSALPASFWQLPQVCMPAEPTSLRMPWTGPQLYQRTTASNTTWANSLSSLNIAHAYVAGTSLLPERHAFAASPWS